jgi:hypothetical protein
MLSKRTLAGLAPLLAVIAFAIAPALAQASPEWLVGTPGTAIPAGGSVAVVSHGGPFVLKAHSGAEVKCTTLADKGSLFAGSPGTGDVTLTFTGCTNTSCPSTGHEVVVHPVLVLLELMSLTEILVIFSEPVEILCLGSRLGLVEETAEGEGVAGAVSGKKLVFTKAGNLSFSEEAGATITGEDEQEGEAAKEAITVS